MRKRNEIRRKLAARHALALALGASGGVAGAAPPDLGCAPHEETPPDRAKRRPRADEPPVREEPQSKIKPREPRESRKVDQ
jgi:hypothetical protein